MNKEDSIRNLRSLLSAACAVLTFGLFAADTPPEGVELVDLTTSGSGSVSSSGTPYANGYAAAKAFDGVTSGSDNRWLTKTVADAWLVYQFNEPTIVNAYTIVNGGSGGANQDTRAVKDFTLKGSNDGENWTTLDTRTGETGWTSGQSRFFSCNPVNRTAYKYYKFQCTANNGNTYVQIHEIYFYNLVDYSVANPALTDLGAGTWHLAGTLHDVDSGNAKLVISAAGVSDVELNLGALTAGGSISFDFNPITAGVPTDRFCTAKIVVPDGDSGTETRIQGVFCFGGVISGRSDLEYSFEIEPSSDVRDALGSSTYTDFPVLLRLSTDITGFNYAYSRWQGYDMMIVDENENELYFEVESWNPSGESFVWVKIPTLSASTKLTCYYGCSKPNPRYSQTAQVWSRYVGVWHFAPSEAGGKTVTDATGHSLDGRTTGNLTTTAGPFGGECLRASAATKAPDYEPAFNVGASFTASGWFKAPEMTSSDYVTVMKKKGSTWNEACGWYTEMSQSFTKCKTILTGDTIEVNGISDVRSNWHQFVVVSDGSKVYVYMDGNTTAKGSRTYTVKANSYEYIIQAAKACNDEYRIRKGAASAAEMALEYQTMVNAAFFTYGEVASTDASAPVIAAPSVVRNNDGSFTISADISENAPKAGSVKCVIGANEYAMSGSGIGTYSVTISDLAADATYVCSVTAESVSGTVIERDGDAAFYNGDITISKISDADENGLVPGVFRISRADTVNDLVVNFTIDDAVTTVVTGQTCVAISSPVTIPDGAFYVDIEVTPLVDTAVKQDTVFKLDLAGGLYGVSSAAGSATMTVRNVVTPDGWNVWMGPEGGLASVGANWSESRAPIATDRILFDGRFSNGSCEWDSAAVQTVAEWCQTNDYTAVVVFDTTFEAYDPTFTNFTITGDANLCSGSWTHHDQKSISAKTNAYHLAVSVGGDLRINAGATISVNGKGATNPTTGAAYGGANGNYDGSKDSLEVWGGAFGNVTEPVDVGISAKADGGCHDTDPYARAGGAIWLKVGGALVVNGPITSNGGVAWGWDQATGSGGSIYLNAASITGSANIQANGGAQGGSNCRNAGSGGRIALVTAANELGVTVSQLTVQGGSQYNRQAASGTIYVKTGASTYGTLYMKFNNVYGPYAYRPTYRFTTEIPAGQTWTFDDIVFIGKGILRVPTGCTLSLPNGLGSVTGNDYEGGIILDGGNLVVPNEVANCTGSWTMMMRVDTVFNGGLALNGPKLGTLNLRRMTDFTPVNVQIKGPLTLSGDSAVDLYGNSYSAITAKDTVSRIPSGSHQVVAEGNLDGHQKFTNTAATDATLTVIGKGFVLYVK